MSTKVKISSWLLAGGFVLFGALFALDVAKFKDIFTELEISLPRLTAAVFVIGPWGWFALAVLAAGSVILNDLRFHSRLLTPILTLLVCTVVLYIVTALFLPVINAAFSAG